MSARASLGQASKAKAKAAEQALDKAADQLRRAEDRVEIVPQIRQKERRAEFVGRLSLHGTK